MLSFSGSGMSWLKRTASTLETMVSVGIRLGVMECFSPYESTCVSVWSSDRDEMFQTQLSSFRRFLFCLVRNLLSLSESLVRCSVAVFCARLSAMSRTVSSK